MKILLHICCGICAGSVVERLISEGNHVTGYFFNPNIHPLEEYEKRLDVANKVSKWLGIDLVAGEYDPEIWLKATAGLAKEPEGGQRCEICYRLRLEAAHRQAIQQGFDAFTTTLTVSPHKPAAVINSIGMEMGGEKFLGCDFKKQDGFKRANEIARKLGAYRQHYCGCVYSINQPHGN